MKSSEIVFDKKVQVTEAKDDKPALNKIVKDSFFKKNKICWLKSTSSEREITNEHRTEGKEKTCTIKLRNNQIQQIGKKINTLNKKER